MKATTPQRHAVHGGPIPQPMVAAGLLTTLNLAELRVYAAIAAHADGRTGSARVAVTTLARLIGRDARTARRCIGRLVAAGAIVADRRGGRAGDAGIAPTFTLVTDPTRLRLPGHPECPPNATALPGHPECPPKADLPGHSECPPKADLPGHSGACKADIRERVRRTPRVSAQQIEQKNNTPLYPPHPAGELERRPAPPPDVPREVALMRTALTGPTLRTAAFETAWREWIEHRRELGKPLTAVAVSRQVRELERLGEGRAIAAIEHSIKRGWRGIFEARGGEGTNHAHEPTRSPARVAAPAGKYAGLAERQRLARAAADAE